MRLVAGLIYASDGNFYGTTSVGGAADRDAIPSGTVFRMTPGGALTTLNTFDREHRGLLPPGRRHRGPRWRLLRHAGFGFGGFGGVTVFSVAVAGDDATVTTLHSFD